MTTAYVNKKSFYTLFLLCQVISFGFAQTTMAETFPSSVQLNLPAGFQVNIFASLAKHTGMPRMLAFDSQGNLYAAIMNAGKVVMLPDVDKDGVAEAPIVVADNLNNPNSVAFIDDNTLLIGNKDAILKLVKQAGKWSAPSTFIGHLPSNGNHNLKTVKVSTMGDIFVNVGSTCNVCDEHNPLRATILSYTTNGMPWRYANHVKSNKNPIYAKGLRNSQSFAWHPKTGAMYATNNGSDMRASNKNGVVNDDIPPEHLNRIENGQHYGWPYCWGEGQQKLVQDPNFLAETADFCQTATPPAITFDSHSTPIGITFLNKTNWPVNYQTNAIVALHGSWNRKIPSGYKLVMVTFEGNKPVKVEDFATGWLTNKTDDTSAWGRPVDVIVGPDGALYVSDDRAGYIYRISYQPPK